MRYVSGACDTAVDNCENLVDGFLCPVLSGNLYTAIVITGWSNSGTAISNSVVGVPSA
jgi:hypothetical protein